MGEHLIDGDFQSDKYPSTPRGLVPLKTNDKKAQPLLWLYAEGHREKDAAFADDVQEALRNRGFDPETLEADIAGALYTNPSDPLVARVIATLVGRTR